MIAWIIGGGGQFGSALGDRVRASGARLWTPGPIPWADPTAAQVALRSAALDFASVPGPWAVVWAAGASVVASDDESTQPEFDALDTLIDAMSEHRPGGRGAFFLASSAGGVYAGSSPAPFSASSDVAPISPYGRLKLRQEQAVARLAADTAVVIGRIANLYGPRTNLAKNQGLIPLLCRASMRRTPLNLYVPMETMRDYLLADDAAVIAWSLIERAIDAGAPGVRIEIIASGRPTSVAEVVATVQEVAHRKVPLALGSDPSAQHQALDLRLVPDRSTWPAGFEPQSLAVGIRRVIDALVGAAA